MNTLTQLLKGTTPMLVLAVLKEGELHGYGIIQAIRERSDGALQAGEGSIYPILHAMEKDGLLKARWQEEGSRPPRKSYRLTPKGQKALEKSVQTWRSYVGSVERVLPAAV